VFGGFIFIITLQTSNLSS